MVQRTIVKDLSDVLRLVKHPNQKTRHAFTRKALPQWLDKYEVPKKHLPELLSGLLEDLYLTDKYWEQRKVTADLFATLDALSKLDGVNVDDNRRVLLYKLLLSDIAKKMDTWDRYRVNKLRFVLRMAATEIWRDILDREDLERPVDAALYDKYIQLYRLGKTQGVNTDGEAIDDAESTIVDTTIPTYMRKILKMLLEIAPRFICRTAGLHDKIQSPTWWTCFTDNLVSEYTIQISNIVSGYVPEKDDEVEITRVKPLGLDIKTRFHHLMFILTLILKPIMNKYSQANDWYYLNQFLSVHIYDDKNFGQKEYERMSELPEDPTEHSLEDKQMYSLVVILRDLIVHFHKQNIHSDDCDEAIVECVKKCNRYRPVRKTPLQYSEEFGEFIVRSAKTVGLLPIFVAENWIDEDSESEESGSEE